MNKWFFFSNKIKPGLSVQYASPEIFQDVKKYISKSDDQDNTKMSKGSFFKSFSRFSTTTSLLSTKASSASQETTELEDKAAVNNKIQFYQKSDMFAFGVIIWELLTRKIPWDSVLPDEIEKAISLVFFFFFTTFAFLFILFSFLFLFFLILFLISHSFFFFVVELAKDWNLKIPKPMKQWHHFGKWHKVVGLKIHLNVLQSLLLSLKLISFVLNFFLKSMTLLI
mgnify:CR=1 FL=1